MATLRHLVRKGSRTVSELALADGVTTQAISLRLRPLVEAGLVSRATDPRDARRTIVSATPSGNVPSKERRTAPAKHPRARSLYLSQPIAKHFGRPFRCCSRSRRA